MKILKIKELSATSKVGVETWHNVVLKEIEPNVFKLVEAHIEVI